MFQRNESERERENSLLHHPPSLILYNPLPTTSLTFWLLYLSESAAMFETSEIVQRKKVEGGIDHWM